VDATTDLPEDIAETLLATMLRIRIFEEVVADLAEKKEFKTPIHLYIGQEAIAAAVCAHLHPDDYIFSTHRNHGHYIAKGGDIKRLLAEIYCRDAGCSHGHGGSIHVVDPGVGFMGSSAIVAGTIPVAVGAGLSAKMDGRGRLAVAFFGDGATDEGVFYESLNVAALYQLPVIFVCENNLFSTHLPLSKRQKTGDLYLKMRGFGIATERVDGNNPAAIYSAFERLAKAGREDTLPSFLECMTFRWRAHVGPEHDIDVGFRRKEDIDRWKSRCPIAYQKKCLVDRAGWTTEMLDQLERKIRREIEDAVCFAKKSRHPDACSLTRGLS
jgi:pyruvate dehydrogenase E1 component alpha subunit